MKKRQTVITAIGGNLSSIVILAGFLLMLAACLDAMAQPGTDRGGTPELSDEDVTELSNEAMTALSDDQQAHHEADGDSSSAVANPAMEGVGILPMEEIDEIDVLRGEASQEEACPPEGVQPPVLDCGSRAQGGKAVLTNEPSNAPTTQIQVTAADNELLLIASTPAGSSELLHYKSGYNKPVDITIYPGAILATGTYSLTMIGINWGGPSAYTVIVTTDQTSQTYTGGGDTNVGANWTNTITMDIVSGQ